MSFARFASAALAASSLGGCYITSLGADDLACPCAEGYTCVGERCVRASRRDGGLDEDAGIDDTGPSVVDAALEDTSTLAGDGSFDDAAGFDAALDDASPIDAFVDDVAGPDAAMPDAAMVDAATPATLRAFPNPTCTTGYFAAVGASGGRRALAGRMVATEAVSVSTIRLRIEGASRASDCDSSPSFTIYAWAEAAGTPASSAPHDAMQMTTPTASSADPNRDITFSLPSSIAIAAGQQLTVAVEGPANRGVCIRSCSATASARAYMSGQPNATPSGTFDWTPINGNFLGITADIE